MIQIRVIWRFQMMTARSRPVLALAFRHTRRHIPPQMVLLPRSPLVLCKVTAIWRFPMMTARFRPVLVLAPAFKHTRRHITRRTTSCLVSSWSPRWRACGMQMVQSMRRTRERVLDLDPPILQEVPWSRGTTPPSLRGNRDGGVKSALNRSQGVSPPLQCTAGGPRSHPLTSPSFLMTPPHPMSPVATVLPLHIARDSVTSLALTITGDRDGILRWRILSFSKPPCGPSFLAIVLCGRQ
jgi:hypothetical protein